ncbi:MAG: hypothetical protein NVSMB51_04630 [Solirubrobacteraceae bacterium]
MTSEGSPYSRFRRALRTGNLALVQAAALELASVDLADALSILLLMSARDDDRYDRAATRWIARFALERPSARLEDLQLGLTALEALPYSAGAARQTIRSLCERHGLGEVVRALR